MLFFSSFSSNFPLFHLFSVCSFGTYGNNCKEECGNCRDKTTCNHIDGSCATGCSAGYNGTLCKKSK